MPRGIAADCAGKALKARESYGRMRCEIKPRSSGEIKPLRECETLRAAGAGEAKQHTTDHLGDFAERTINHTEGVASFHHVVRVCECIL